MVLDFIYIKHLPPSLSNRNRLQWGVQQSMSHTKIFISLSLQINKYKYILHTSTRTRTYKCAQKALNS